MKAVDLAHKYNEFQKQIGRSLEGDFDATIASLFSEKFKKIINGETTVNDRRALKNQLQSCRDIAGNWTIDVKDVAPFEDPERCLIRYQLASDKLGTFDVMATLRGNSTGEIEEVDEIYYIVGQ